MKGNSEHFSGTSGDIISIGHMLQVTPPNKLGNEWKDTTNPKAKENGSNRTSYTNTNNGMKIEFDKGVKGANGFKGKDHYHIKNPSSTGKSDYYLDINGNPCPKNSTKSHIVIKKGGYK